MQKSLDRQLCQSSRRGDANEVVSLLERGANVNSTVSGTHNTPLHISALNGYVECIKALLDSGAEVDKPNIEGSTPLHAAASEGHEECIKALLDSGAEVDKTNKHGRTPLHQAALNEHVECIKVLLDSGGEVNRKTSRGNTPLHVAVWQGRVECVMALLCRGADVNMKNTQGQTALYLVLQCGRKNVADAILHHMSRRSEAQQGGDQRTAQNSSGSLRAKKRKLSTQLAAARSRIVECEEQLAIAKLRNDENEAQLARALSRNDKYEEQLETARSRNAEYEVHMACMTGQGDVLASQDVNTLERLSANVDMECLRKAIFDKRVQRELHKARDAAAECGVCISAPKDTCLDPCGHTMCRSCSDLIQVCPICRQQVAGRRRVFL
eukprot:gene1802-biopygen14623